MIVFLSSYPTDENVRDGMMQRVAAIDLLAKKQPRVYLDISFKKNLRRATRSEENCKIEYLNFFLHFFIILHYLKIAKKIYSHSVINLFKVHFFYKPSKTILDIHGVVPEELEFLNKHIMSTLLSYVEKKAILNCQKLIHVTDAMLQHYEIKYNCDLTTRSLVLPIFESESVNYNYAKWNDDVLRVVYAGGMQAWQNIDMMVDSVANLNTMNPENKMHFNFFFPKSQVTIFNEKYPNLSLMHNVSVSSLPKDEILTFLTQCHFGFVLRDDILVNKVACPTKLIEYLECGVIPVIKSPYIGDFHQLGYKFMSFAELITKANDRDLLLNMSQKNDEVVKTFKDVAEKSKNKLSVLLS